MLLLLEAAMPAEQLQLPASQAELVVVSLY